MPIPLEWAVVYADGSIFTNEDGEPWECPRGGVQAVVEADPAVGHVVHKRGDIYVYDPDWGKPNWRIMDQWGLAQHMLTPGLKCVLFGSYVSNEAYNAAAVIAHEFGQKTEWLLFEHKDD